MLKENKTNPSRGHALGVLLCAVSFCLFPGGAHAATPAQIDRAIKKAVDYLYAHEQPQGNWEYPVGADYFCSPTGRNFTGRTALVTYALLAAGEQPKNEHLTGPISFLEKNPTVGTYAVGVRAQVWPYLRQSPELHEAEQIDARVLLASVGTKGEANGLWYYSPPNTGSYDHSVSQFGILGLWALDRKGIEIPLSLWQLSDEAWRKHQLPDGSWCYCNSAGSAAQRQGTATMTAAGVATLFITSDYVHQHFNSNEVADANIESGLKWLGDHFNLFFANGIDNVVTQWYGMYGLERIGVASGRKYLGTHNWFVEGSDWLTHNQNADGSWGAPGDIWGFNQQNILDTSFAILFLARGRAPVIMEKVQYSVLEGNRTVPGHWNRAPRDLANFSRWMSTQLEADYNWQVTSLDVPDQDLHDAPILYISGDQTLTFSDSDVAKLKQFVEEGGLILGNADSQSAAFAKSFKELGSKLFPSYAFRELPESHPIYVNEEFHAARWRIKPHVEGLSNGVRELMLLPAVDMSRVFQSGRDATQSDVFQLADDIVLYSVDTRGLEQKGETYTVAEDAKAPIERTVKIARLQYDGNWDPEPGGWRRLAAVLHNSRKTRLQVETVKLGDGTLTRPPADAAPPSPRPAPAQIRLTATKRITPEEFQATGGDPAKMQALVDAKVKEVQAELDAAEARRLAAMATYKLAHLTGTDEVKLTEAQRHELKGFVEGGGTLIIDAAGGSTAFAASAEQMLRDTFGSDASQLESPLPADCPLYQPPGLAVEEVQYRQFARSRISNTRMPQLRGIRIGPRLAVIWSREDLSAGLVGEPVDGITGYTPASATDLVTNIVLNAGKK